MSKYIDPLSDPGFKILFGRESSKDILIGFLNMLLEKDGNDPIVDVTHLDKEQVREQTSERSILYDIHCETSCGRRFIVEMQNNVQNFFVDRSIFYMARAVTEQGKSGRWRYEFKPVYGIFFTNFNIIGNENKLRTDVALVDTDTGKQFSDKLRMIYIQLPRFDKTDPKECTTDFERWIYILKNMENLVTMPFTDMGALYQRIEEVGRIESLAAEERVRYERELKAYRDYNNRIETAKEMGIEEGFAKGEAKGRKEGEAKGRKEGKRDIINAMLSNGVSLTEIARMLNLTLDEVTELTN